MLLPSLTPPSAIPFLNQKRVFSENNLKMCVVRNIGPNPYQVVMHLHTPLNHPNRRLRIVKRLVSCVTAGLSDFGVET